MMNTNMKAHLTGDCNCAAIPCQRDHDRACGHCTCGHVIGADLQDARLHYAVLRGARLNHAVLRGSRLYGADLTGADLTGADLMCANLLGADLTNALRLPDDPPIPGWILGEDDRLSREEK